MAAAFGYSSTLSMPLQDSTSKNHKNDYISYLKGDHPKYDAAIAYFENLILKELSSFNIRTWVGGGAVRDYFLYNQITSDVDLYFPNDEQYNAAKEWILNNTIPFTKTPLSEYYQIQKEKGVIVRELKNSLKIRYKGIDIDLVKMHRLSEVETIKSFDMTVCAAAVSTNGVFMVNDFLLDLASKQIRFQSLHSPFSTLIRLQKYIKKGFSCSYNEMHKLAYEIKNVPITEINPVEFQLDQLEQQYGVPRNTPKRRDMASGGTDGFGGNPCEILEMPPATFVSPQRYVDNTARPSVIDQIMHAFTPAAKEHYDNAGY